jgi:predicted RNase H-like HicB family nuclease
MKMNVIYEWDEVARVYSATCTVLGNVSSFGATKEEALLNLKQAVKLNLHELDKYLQELDKFGNTKAVKQVYGKLFEKFSQIIFKHDPIGISFINDEDEYDPEVGTILPRLKDCKNFEDLYSMIYEEFVEWFGDIAGNKEKYAPLAEEFWKTWEEFNASIQ